MQTWNWGRENYTAPVNTVQSTAFPYSLLTQPEQLDDYGRAWLQLNSIAPFIPPLVLAPR